MAEFIPTNYRAPAGTSLDTSAINPFELAAAQRELEALERIKELYERKRLQNIYSNTIAGLTEGSSGRFNPYDEEVLSPAQIATAAELAAAEEVSLFPDADLLGRTQIFEGGVPFFQPDVVYPQLDPTQELPEPEYEITEPVVTFEEPAVGGGGGAPAATAEAEQQAATQAAQQPATTATTTPVGQESDIIDLERAWVYLGNGRFRNIRTGQEAIETQGDYIEGEVYSRGDETPVTDVAQQEQPEEEISLVQEIFMQNLSASDMTQRIIQDTMADQAAATGGTSGGTGGGTGAGEGPGSDGGLGGVGMLAGLGSQPTEFTQPEPFKRVSLGYRPVQMERARMFDFIDYNPLRNMQ